MKCARSARRERDGRPRHCLCSGRRPKQPRPSTSCQRRSSTGSAPHSSGNGCIARGSWRPIVVCLFCRFTKSLRRNSPWAWPMFLNCLRSCRERSTLWEPPRRRGESPMRFLKEFLSSCLTGRGRSTIAILLAVVIACGLIAPPPAMAQLGAIAVTAAAAAVVSLILNTIGSLLGTANGLLGSINGFVQALANLWQNVVYPINLINQALAMVNQLIAQFRGLVAAIDNVNVRSATLPNPSSLETIMRNRSVGDFAQFDQAFRRTFQ